MLFLLVVLCASSFDETLRSGLLALNSNNLPLAQSQLEAASKLQPSDPRALLGLARTYWRLHKAAEADSAASRAQTLIHNPALLQALATYYSETGNVAKTAEVARSAAQYNGDESYYFSLADLCLKQQNFAAALDVLIAARKTYPRSAQLQLAAGVAYYGLRRFPESIDAFLRTIELDPSAEQPYLFLGRMFEQSGDKLPRVKTAFATLQKSSPDSYLSCYLMAKVLELDEPVRAETYLRKSIDLNGSFPDSHFDLGVLLDSQRRFAEAAAQIERAIELNPNDPVLHYRLSRLYERLGKAELAARQRELHARLSK